MNSQESCPDSRDKVRVPITDNTFGNSIQSKNPIVENVSSFLSVNIRVCQDEMSHFGESTDNYHDSVFISTRG
jgi:hypothetical protein